MVDKLEAAFRAGYDAGYNFEAGVTEQWDTENAAWSRYAATLSTPTEDARSRVKVLEEALRNHIEWLEGIQGFAWDEIVADGGVTAWMVIQQEARTVQLPRARAALGNKETDRHG